MSFRHEIKTFYIERLPLALMYRFLKYNKYICFNLIYNECNIIIYKNEEITMDYKNGHF